MAAPNPQQAPNQVYMIRPNQIDNLPNLQDQVKNQYKQGLTALWSIVESNAPESKERQDAEGKIRVASQKLMSQLRGQRPGSAAGQQRPNTQPQQQQPGQQSQQQQQPPPQMTPDQARMFQQQQAQAMQNMQARQAVQLKPAGQPGQQPNAPQQQ